MANRDHLSLRLSTMKFSQIPELFGLYSLPVVEADPRKYMDFNVFMVRTVGLLPNVAPPGRQRVASIALNWLVRSWLGLHVLSELCDIYQNILNVSALAKNVTVTFVALGAWIRHIFYSQREASYYSLVDTVSKRFVSTAFTSSPQRCSMSRYIRQSRMTVVVYFMYGCVVIWYWLCHPMFSPARLIYDDVTNTTREVWDFPCGAWYPFDATTPGVYGFVYFFQSVGIFLGGYMIMVTDMMFISLSLVICGQLEILNDSLRHILETAASTFHGDTTDFKQEEGIVAKISTNSSYLIGEINSILTWCVEHHNMLLKLIKDVEKLHWFNMLIDFTFQLVILSFLAFEATTVTVSNRMKIANIVTYLTLAILQLFLLCRSGDKLMEQQESIAGAVYDSRWYDCPESFRRSLRIIVLQARQPVKVTAGKVGSLDMDTFSGTLSKAFSYFTVLREIRG
ncbi:odorant receptor 83a-like [Anabrus simplex]|uniref:odorant receptor 83a-like n=1 Tax=Anabrus simplex TaxID=316456 RepID=UPI0035A3CC32